MISRICVVGGTGFLGSYIVDVLAGAGFEVTVYSRSPERFRPPKKGVRYILGDFADTDALTEAVRGADIVVHTLTTVTVHSSNADIYYDIQSNLVATLQLMDICVAQRVKRLLFLSSGGAVYGPTDISPTPETVSPRPVSSYGATKLAIEHYLSVFQARHGLEYAALRIANPYGPRQNPHGQQGVIAIFAHKLLRGEEICIFGDGSAQRDYIHARDCAEATFAAVTSDKANYVANVGCGKGISLNTVLSTLERVAGVTGRIERTSSRSADVTHSVLDSRLFQRLTGWVPRTAFDDGIPDVVSWIRSADL